MKKTLLTSILLIVISIASSQEIVRKSAHQQQKEQFGSSIKLKSSFDPNGADIIPLQMVQSKSVSKIVFGFLPYWEYTNGAHDNLQYDLLTHIAAFDFKASASGSITNPSGWPWTNVINAAHTEGVKVIMTVTNFNSSQLHTILTSITSKNNLFSSIKNTITNYQLDGVNIDFEGLDSADRGSLINIFMADLTSYIHTNLPGKEVSFDAPAVNWSGWQLNDLAKVVDHLIIMAYDYNGAWSNYSSAVAPLTHPTGGISVTKSLTNDYSAPIANYPEKIVLAVPYYGKQWETSSSSAGSSITSYVGNTFFRLTAVASDSYGGDVWDSNSQTPYYAWQSSGTWNQVWAENEESLGLKYDLALSKNLGGIGIWALNYDGNRSELWDLIESKFSSSLAVDDSFIKQNLKVYPNPAKDKLYVSNKGIHVTHIEIYNLLGQKLNSYNANIEVLDISELKSAVYYLNIQDENGNKATYKIIKS